MTFWFPIANYIRYILYYIRKDMYDLPMVNLAVGAIIKDEGPYLFEWIEFHKKMGVERFYIFDNGSGDDSKDILKPYIEDRTVIWHRIDGVYKQMKAYNIILKLYGNISEWIAFIDADEFLYLKNGKDLKSFLKDKKDVNGIGVNWIVFGTSNKKTKPQGDVVKNYDKCLIDTEKINHTIKSIVNSKKAVGFKLNPHVCNYIDGGVADDEMGVPIEGNLDISPTDDLENVRAYTTSHSTNFIAINHYYTKSEEEFYARCMRGKADGDGGARLGEAMYQRGMNLFKEDNQVLNNDLIEILKRRVD